MNTYSEDFSYMSNLNIANLARQNSSWSSTWGITIALLFPIFKYILENYLYSLPKKIKLYFENSQKVIVSANEINHLGKTIINNGKEFKAICWLIDIANKRNLTANKLKILKQYIDSNDSSSAIYIPVHNGEILIDKIKDENAKEDELKKFMGLKFKFYTEKYKPIALGKNENLDKTDFQIQNIHLVMVISEVYSTSQIKDLIVEIVKKYNDYLDNDLEDNQYIFTLENKISSDGNLMFHKNIFHPINSWDTFYHPEKENIINEIDNFNNRQDWYEKNGKPYTKSFMCFGPPGTGKTTFMRVLAQYTNRHIIIFDFSYLKNINQLRELFHSEYINGHKIPNSKRLYICDDADRMTDILYSQEFLNSKKNSRSNKEFEKTFNLSDLLNIIDGFHTRHSQMMVWCCNYPERLDKALTRPGRFDRKLKFGYLEVNDIKTIIEKYYEMEFDNNQLQNLLKLGNKWKASELQAILCRYSTLPDVVKHLETQELEDFETSNDEED